MLNDEEGSMKEEGSPVSITHLANRFTSLDPFRAARAKVPSFELQFIVHHSSFII
jgi:hypothetical protein